MRKELHQSEQAPPVRYNFPMYRALVIVLVLVLAGLQYRLWVSDGSISELHRLRETKQELQSAIRQARARNKALAATIENLKSGKEAMIGRARSDIGMIKAGETFYLTVGSSETDEAIRRVHKR